MSQFYLVACCATLLIGTGWVTPTQTLPLRSASIHSHNRAGDRNAAALVQVRAALEAEKVTHACLEAINALRTDKVLGFSSPLNAFAQDSTLEDQAEKTVKDLAGGDAKCSQAASAKSSRENPGILVSFPYGETRKCQDLINASYLDGMKNLVGTKFDPSASQYDRSPFAYVNSANVAYLMSHEPTKVGCAWTKGCEAGENLLFCKVDTALDENQSPFSADVYTAMVQRYLTTSAATIALPGVVSVALLLFGALLMHL